MLAKFWDLKCCFKKLEAMGNYAPLTELASAVLYARGYEDLSSAKGFLDTGKMPLFDPFLLDDMDRAVATIQAAIRDNKKIFVYGDYDVDGITATYVVYDYLRSVGANCSWQVPDRVQNGYVMSQSVLDDMKARGAELIITVDNGITAAAEVDYATSIGLDIVITDHHECPTGEGARLPEARAVVNPMRPNGRMEFPRLAGVGVAFKLVSALS
ncbi:MAG: DHH family phosphoesterase, partial [Clostridia bacterium]|nr:DHH family phosphoesterase [Clostridia bacterium]